MDNSHAIDLTLPMTVKEHEEVLIAVPQDDKDQPFIWDGAVSDIYQYVFSELWRDHMYSEYSAYYWSEIHEALKKANAPSEVIVQISYEFGATTEEAVREYMEETKDDGKRFLIMPRGDVVTMCCAHLLSFEVKPLDAL